MCEKRRAKSGAIRKGDGGNIEYEIDIAAPDESFLFYSNEERDRELGCVGHLRGDFGRSGNEFWTTRWEHLSELKTQDFREKLDLFVNTCGSRDC